ncbi:MAG: hypothetical protein LBC85_05590 [Fibromonadaceae bacterium]|jgi:hypothetical protein|nr:hypothetical protein [Fibromonadaceae bacterium]
MLRLLMLLAVLLIVACASSAVSRDPEKTNEVMITFVTRARAGFWGEAMQHVTPAERQEMMDEGNVLPEYREAVARIRLSTIRNMELGLDSRGRLVGLKDLLDESNDMNRANADKVELDPTKFEDLSAKAKRRQQEEEEQRIEREEQAQEEEKEQDSESFLDRLLREAPRDF